MNNTLEFEQAIAFAWFDGSYTQAEAERSAFLQGVDFDNVKEFYSQMYHDREAKSAGVNV